MAYQGKYFDNPEGDAIARAANVVLPLVAILVIVYQFVAAERLHWGLIALAASIGSVCTIALVHDIKNK